MGNLGITEATYPQTKKGTTLPSMIKNKEKRSVVHAKLKREKKIEKRKQAKAREAAIKRALDLGEEASSFPLDLHLLLGFRFSGYESCFMMHSLQRRRCRGRSRTPGRSMRRSVDLMMKR